MSETTQQIDRYVVEKMLGRGSMGIVYKAHDPEIDRPVAIKLVRMDLLESEHRDDYLARFKREVQAAGRCVHRNIVAMYDFGSHEGNPFFVMEYVDAPPLDEALPKGAGLGPHGATPIVLQLLDALSCAHGLGVVHRDIKPSNMLLTADRRVKVMDFGISHISTSHLTQVGSVLGTPRYMSPEQFRGDVVDARSDLFSTGAVLHELLTGRPPIAGRSFEEVMVKLLHDGIELAPADPLMPEPMRAVVLKALERDPARRFESADVMAQALTRALAEVDQRGGWADQPVADGRTVYHPSSTPRAPHDLSTPSMVDSPSPPPVRGDASRTAEGQSVDDIASDALLSTIERRLAQHIGPLASRLMRRALKDADSIETLCQRLAAEIEPAAERESFLRDVQDQVLATAGASHSAPRPPSAASLSVVAPSVSPEELAKLERDLMRYIGPFARILVKRTAPTATSVADLRDKLANHLDQPSDRTAFLAGR